MHRICVPLLCAALTSLSFAQQTRPQEAVSLPVPSPAMSTVAATAAPAAGTPPLSLAQAVETALRLNPQLRAAGLELEATQGSVLQAGAFPNPTLGFEQEDTRPETRVSTFQLSQPIELGGKRAARIELAQRSRAVARADVDARLAEIRAATVQAFFEALVAQERVALARESRRVAATALDAAARRVIAGKVAPTEETRARVAEATARVELSQAETDRAASLHGLTALMGVADDAVTALDGRADLLPQPPANEVLADRLARSPTLRRAQLEAQRLGAAYELERARRLPDVTVSLGARRAQELGRTQPIFGISIPLPIFNANQGAQLEALRRREAAEAQAQAEALRLRAEVLQAADQLRGRRREIETLQREVLPGAASAFEAAARGFELGKFDFLVVLDAQRTLLQARAQYLRTLSDAHRASADLNRRLGAADGAVSGANP